MCLELMAAAEQHENPDESLRMYSQALEELDKTGLIPKVKNIFEEMENPTGEWVDEDEQAGTGKESDEKSQERNAKKKKGPLSAEERFAQLKIEALGGRASVYGYLEDFPKALEDLTAALAIDSYHIDSLIRRGEIHLKMKNHKDAAKDFNRVREVQPDHIDAVYYLTLMLRVQFKNK